MNRTPPKLNEEMSADPHYKHCALFGWHNHECDGRITREHTLTYAGSTIEEKWAIIPLCARGHAVDNFQDAGTLNKELNVWVALNRATPSDLKRFSKAIDYLFKRNYLNGKYGVWYPKYKLTDPSSAATGFGGIVATNIAAVEFKSLSN